MAFKLPTELQASDGLMYTLADQTTEYLAAYAISMRNEGWISYAEWRTKGMTMMQQSPNDDTFDKWCGMKASVTIDAIEQHLHSRQALGRTQRSTACPLRLVK